MKICTKCRKDRPLNEFYWRKERQTHVSACKACCNKAQEFYRLENKDRDRELQKRWRTDHPSYQSVAQANLKALDRIELEEWTELLNRYGWVCMCCNATGDLTMDHIIPLSKGGKNRTDNVQILCRHCNSAKGTRTVNFRKLIDRMDRSLLTDN